ncbi:MAG: HAMP domain-containing protein, partial [Oscillochloris sp.]|nr:HAMP domain-containing protein [Oscillochloris sp.]
MMHVTDYSIFTYMRPRIFILMLIAFALVIILGVGGMVAFFGLTVASIESRSTSAGILSQSSVRAEARDLAGYYRRHDSWDGVNAQFSELEGDLNLSADQTATLVDVEGAVLASTGVGQEASSSGYSQRVPISSNGEVVGTLVISYGNMRSGMPGMMIDGKRILKGFASAGLALAAILLALATFFSRQISHPMDQLTNAAQALADGDMSVRVRPSALREVGDLAAAFNRMADSLVQADQQRRQLTADVAHELRTPLSIIKGRLEGIQDGVYNPDEPQIAGLLGEVALLERLIDDLRLLALAEAGQLALYPEAVSPARLAHDVGAAFALQAAERSVRLQVETESDLPELTVDPQRITQVLGN